MMTRSRKEISKEEMFNKLMPTGSSKHTVAPNIKLVKPFDPYVDERDEIAAEIQADQKKEKEPDADQSEAETTEEKKEPQEQSENDEHEKNASDTKDESEKGEENTDKPASSGSSEEIKPNENAIQTIMVNIREKMVMAKLDEALEKFKCCTCFFCRQDVTCMALNSLKPKYIVTTEADIDKIIEAEDFSEVTQAVMKAILYVKTHPRH